MISYRPRLVDEICANAQLHGFGETLHEILIDIYKEGCMVTCRCIRLESSFKRHPLQIRLSLKDPNKHLDAIWELLHEYGHFLSPVVKGSDSKIQREEWAWFKADQALEHYPALAGHLGGYEACKERCIKTYREAHAKGEIT